MRQSKLIKRTLDTWGGVLATLAIAALIERGRVSGEPFPIPFLLLYASVALSANRGGLRAGLLSGLIASGFIIYASQIPFGPPTLTGGILEVSLGILLHMGSALVISLTTSQRDRYLSTLEERTGQLESQVAARTQDLSEANQTLRQSEARFRTLIEKSADAIVMFDASSKPVYASPSAATILGYTAEEISGLERLDKVHPDDKESARDRFSWLLEHPGETLEAEARILHKDGRWRVVQGISRNLLNDPVVSAIVTNFRDITERKHAEDTLRESERRFSRIFHDSPIATVLTRASDSVFVDVNDKMMELTGFARDELVGRTSLELNLFVNPQARSPLTEKTRDGGDYRNIEMQLRTKSGEERYVSMSTVVIELDGEMHVISMAHDITEAKQTEDALRESEAILRSLYDSSNMHMGVIDLVDRNQRFVSNNRAHSEAFGLTPEQTICKTSLDLGVSPTTVELWTEKYLESKQSNNQVHFEYKDSYQGKEFWYLGRVNYLGEASSGYSRFSFIAEDITERKKAEEQNRYLATLIEYVSDAIISTDSEFKIQSWNKAAEAIYGWQAHEAIGEVFTSITKTEYPFDDAEDVLIEFRDTGSWIGEVVQERKDGTMVSILSSVSAVYDSMGKQIGVVAVNRDITQQKHLREEQLEREKLQFALTKEQELNAFRGLFMSMVSHDIRTPLTIIQTSANMLQVYKDRLTPEKFDRRIEQISTQVMHLTEMLDSVMLVIRGQSGRLDFNPTPTDLCDFCERLVETMKGIAADNQRLIFSSGGDIGRVRADEELLRHILTNLISNAIKYSPDGGEIHVSALRNTANLLLQVSDEGIGIPLEDHPHLFEPYRRASNIGKIIGSGLGLSIVKLCAEAHGGSVEVSSQSDKGTTFTVNLPIS